MPWIFPAAENDVIWFKYLWRHKICVRTVKSMVKWKKSFNETRIASKNMKFSLEVKIMNWRWWWRQWRWGGFDWFICWDWRCHKLAYCTMDETKDVIYDIWTKKTQIPGRWRNEQHFNWFSQRSAFGLFRKRNYQWNWVPSFMVGRRGARSQNTSGDQYLMTDRFSPFFYTSNLVRRR